MKLANSGKIADILNENMKEALFLQNLKHKHIIGIEEAFVSNKNEMSLEFNLVIELAEGGNLYTKIL